MRLGHLLLALSLGLVLLSGRALAQPADAPVVVLYTIGMGDDPFERFGHTTLCLRYRRHAGESQCFDFGAADFVHVEETAWLFLRGQGSFFLEADREARMFNAYKEADRDVWRQVLPLTTEEAELLAARLQATPTGKKARYPYRLLDDNCATRLRDVLDDVLLGKLRAATAGQPGDGVSYREYGRRGFADLLVGLWVFDLFLTDHADRIPDRWQQMFMPDKLRDEVARLLGVEPEQAYARKGPSLGTDPGLGGRPWFLALGLALAVPLALARRFGRLGRTAVVWATLWLGLLALVVWVVAALSTFPEQRHNLLCFVLLPTDLALPFLREAVRRRYARTRLLGLAIVALLAAVGVLRSPLWAPLALVALPMLVLAFVRPRKGPPAAAAPAPAAARRAAA
ncbi:MAG: DUF4105 domain-containing protein [Myxococcales bacterium]|nr:DUF4105 domain-containing protein [Myxococcales bacterium]